MPERTRKVDGGGVSLHNFPSEWSGESTITPTSPYDKGTMFVFFLLLVLLAIALGILGAVIKVATFVVLTMITVVALLGVVGYFAFKWQMGKISRALEKRLRPPSIDDRY